MPDSFSVVATGNEGAVSARCCTSSPVRPDMVTAGEIRRPPPHGYLISPLLSGALHPLLANTASPLRPHVMTEDRELMSLLAEALDDFDAPTGSSMLGARAMEPASSLLLPFLAASTISPHVLHHEVADPATLRLLADALDAFDEPGGGGGNCVHGARVVESSSASFLYPRVASPLDTNSASLCTTVDSESEPLVPGTQSAPCAAHRGRADWGGQSYHSDAALIQAAYSTQTLTAHRRSQRSNTNSTQTQARTVEARTRRRRLNFRC